MTPSLRAKRSNLTSLLIATLIVLTLTPSPSPAAESCWRYFTRFSIRTLLVVTTGAAAITAGVVYHRDHIEFEKQVKASSAGIALQRWDEIGTVSDRRLIALAENWIRGSQDPATEVQPNLVFGVSEALETIHGRHDHPDWENKKTWSSSDRAKLRAELVFLLRRDQKNFFKNPTGDFRRYPHDLRAVLLDAGMFRRVRNQNILTKRFAGTAGSTEAMYAIAAWTLANPEKIPVITQGFKRYAAENGAPGLGIHRIEIYHDQVKETAFDGFHDGRETLMATGGLPVSIESYIYIRYQRDGVDLPTYQAAIDELLELGERVE